MYIQNEYGTAIIKVESIDAFQILKNRNGYGLYVFCNGDRILFTENEREKDTIKAFQSIIKAFEFEIEDREW
jgi:hypothetical protein